MLNKLFDIDNPIMRFLSDLFDLMVLNIITVILCIPVITAVPALTALHYMTLKIVRHEQSYIIRPYLQSFIRNLKQSFIIGLLFIAIGVIMYMDCRVIWAAQDLFPEALRVVFIAAVIIVVLLLLWVIPLQAHFENTIRGTLRNSVFMSIGNFPRTLLMAVVWLIPIGALLISYSLWPLVFMFGLSLPAFLSGKVYSPVFKRFEPEEETTADELFEMRDEDIDAFSRELHSTFGENNSAEN